MEGGGGAALVVGPDKLDLYTPDCPSVGELVSAVDALGENEVKAVTRRWIEGASSSERVVLLGLLTGRDRRGEDPHECALTVLEAGLVDDGPAKELIEVLKARHRQVTAVVQLLRLRLQRSPEETSKLLADLADAHSRVLRAIHIGCVSLQLMCRDPVEHPFLWVTEKREETATKTLADYLYHSLKLTGRAVSGTDVYRQMRTPAGHLMFTFVREFSVEEYVSRMCMDPVTAPEPIRDLAAPKGNQKAMVDFLQGTATLRLPPLLAYQFSFRNGVFRADTLSWYPYPISEEDGRKLSNSAGFVDEDFELHAGVDWAGGMYDGDWYEGVPTPEATHVLTTQGLTSEVQRVVWALGVGRMFFPIGETLCVTPESVPEGVCFGSMDGWEHRGGSSSLLSSCDD